MPFWEIFAIERVGFLFFFSRRTHFVCRNGANGRRISMTMAYIRCCPSDLGIYFAFGRHDDKFFCVPPYAYTVRTHVAMQFVSHKVVKLDLKSHETSTDHTNLFKMGGREKKPSIFDEKEEREREREFSTFAERERERGRFHG